MRAIPLAALLLAISAPACSARRCCAPVCARSVSTPASATVVVAPARGVAPTSAPTVGAPALDADDPEVLWSRLLEGNARYRAGRALHPRQDAARRSALANTQAPKVVVLACADSRVPPEVLFDQGLGDLFVVRVAGNVATPEVEASIEYAIDHLGSRLVVVLGHERCGAVTSAMAGGEAPGHLPGLFARIQPAIDATPAEGPDRLLRVVTTNARLTTELLAQNPVMKGGEHHHPVVVRAAVVDLDTGEVTAVPSASAASPAR